MIKFYFCVVAIDVLPVAPSPSLLPPIAIVIVVAIIAIIVNFVAHHAVAIVVVAHRAVAIIVDFVARRAVAIVPSRSSSYPAAPSPSSLSSPPVAIIVNFVAPRAVAIDVVAHRAVAIVIVDFVARRAVAIVSLPSSSYPVVPSPSSSSSPPVAIVVVVDMSSDGDQLHVEQVVIK
jgi:hypothetical protein